MSNRGMYPGDGGRYKPVYPRNQKIWPELFSRVRGTLDPEPTTSGAGSTINVQLVVVHDTQWQEAAMHLLLAAGKYTFSVYYQKGSNRGIFQFDFDSVPIGSVDSYDGSTTVNNLASFDFECAFDGMHELRSKCIDKNGSSSGFSCVYQFFLIRERMYR